MLPRLELFQPTSQKTLNVPIAKGRPVVYAA